MKYLITVFNTRNESTREYVVDNFTNIEDFLEDNYLDNSNISDFY